jgi:hypothetical protein
MSRMTTDTGAPLVTPGVDQEPINRDEELERFWRAVDQIRARNADKNPAEEMDFITKVVEEVRQAHHDRDQAEGRR